MAKYYVNSQRGRIGNTVYRKGQNATIAAKYQPVVKNPKTVQQSFVRAAFATTSAAQSALLSIVNHSFENQKDVRTNLQRFFRINQKRILGQIKNSYKTGDDLPGWLNLKGVAGIQPYAYVLSEGSVPFVPVQEIALATISGTAYGGSKIATFNNTALSEFQDQAGYVEQLALFGLAPGDELAFVGIYHTESIVGSFESSVGQINDLASVVYASRVTFVSQLPDNFDGPLFEDGKFNPALILRQEGDMRIASGAVDTAGNTPFVILDGRGIAAGLSLNAAAIIRSQVDMNGKYRYSNAIMAFSGEADDSYYATESYLPNAAVSDGSDKFLDNPALPN